MIHGLQIVPKRQIVDDRGKIMHILRNDDPEFEVFGEVYFSWVNPGKIKAWHLHRLMTLNYVCPVGSVRLVLFDDRSESPTRGVVQSLVLDQNPYRLVRVPVGVWNGFSCIGDVPAMVCNVATEVHSSDEIIRKDLDDPGFPPVDW